MSSRLTRSGYEAVGCSRASAEVRGPFDLVVLCGSGHRGADEIVQQVDALLAFMRENGFGGSLEGPHGLVIKPRARAVWVNGRPVNLTAKAFDVLRLLLERSGEVVSVDEIALAVWGHPTFGSPNFVEAQISRVRSRLAAAGAEDVIETIRGAGYVIRYGQRPRRRPLAA